jgi:quercetin dioxygenase-like cupin family protein
MERLSVASAETTEPFDGTHLTKLVEGTEMSMQHVEMDPGTVVDQHTHPNEQVSYVVDGMVTFLLESGDVTVGPGESVFIAGNEPHGAANRGTDPAVVVEAFHPPR